HCCCWFDGAHYMDILGNGYRFDPGQPSNVAFLPGYPLTARLVARATGCRPPTALVVTSNVAFAAALVLISAYLRTRFPGEHRERHATLALVGLWPVGFFFRVGYSESLLLVTLALLLLGLARRWPAAAM